MEPVVAVYDACVLYSSFLRDFLVRLAIHGRRQGVMRGKWTGRIHREWIRAVHRNNPHIPLRNLQHISRLMDQAIPGCRVRNYQRWERRLTLPDPNDRHVLAAALACVANVIVTHNDKDFPASLLQPFGIAAVGPDAFAFQFFDSGIVVAAAAEHRASLSRPTLSTSQYLDAMRRNGLSASAAELITHHPTSF